MGDLDRRLLRRRELLGLAWRSTLGLGLLGCGPEREYQPKDAARLAEQRLRERMQAGRGPFGSLRFRGYRGLAELPWFEISPEGRLRLVGDAAGAIDLHAHLGMALLFAPDLDLQARSPRVQHMLDCDGLPGGCELDLDVYVNDNFGDEAFTGLRRTLIEQFLWGSDQAQTHTIPNLLDEMDAMGIAKAAILPIAFGLPFGDALTEQWMEAIRVSGAGARLLPGASVHPRDPDKIARLRGYAAAGARIVKLHPAGQRFYADEPVAMEIYAECQRMRLPVFFHAGRAGIEPEAGLNYNLLRHMRGALSAFPRLQFVLGHAGARDIAEAIPLARRHDNVWLGTHGQGATQLARLMREVGAEKLVFGSDWPWYHLGASLAKVLIVTEGQPEARQAILRGNAERLLAAAPGPGSSDV
ncbi:MAG: amidohydrolase family protein [Myxococcota bacterium]